MLEAIGADRVFGCALDQAGQNHKRALHVRDREERAFLPFSLVMGIAVMEQSACCGHVTVLREVDALALAGRHDPLVQHGLGLAVRECVEVGHWVQRYGGHGVSGFLVCTSFGLHFVWFALRLVSE